MRLMMEAWGMRVERAGTAEEGLALLQDSAFDLVMTDVCLPGKSGFDVLTEVKQRKPDLPVILITGQGDVRGAVEAIKKGAFDYALKPLDADTLEITVRRALEAGRLRQENQYFRREMASLGVHGPRLVGRSANMLAVYDRIDRVAATDSTVLIVSETGTGKELVAQTIHYRSKRAAAPFVACNCAALNSSLLESELFGHEKGAFTGAIAARRGRFEEAEGGTIFLDEIGETSREFQAKLLRVLQEREIERVGSSRKIKIDVRIIASTNRDLEKEVAEHRFREDLYYRLKVVPITLPPLRERKEDIMELARYFIRIFAAQYDRPVPDMTADAQEYLLRHNWPGNVRELKNALERAMVLAAHDELTRADFEPDHAPPPPDTEDPTALNAFIDAATRRHVVRILDRTGWERKRAADLLGIDRVTLYRLLRRLDVKPDGGELEEP
jgi:DNA-binding NtrC family response regulator